jgi:hypothetical protein
MKKLYLLATLAMVAFSGIAGNEDVAKSFKKALPVKTEFSKKLKASGFKAEDLAAKKKSVLKQVEDQKKAEEQKELEQKSTASAKHLYSLVNEKTLDLKFSNRDDATDFSAVKSSASKKGALYAPTINEYGIITEPGEGTTKFYKRSGGGYFLQSQQLYTYDQSSLDLLETVEASDGTVYFKNLVGKYTSGAWVKGTKSGNKITVPTRQPVNYNSQYKTTLSVRWGTIAENSLVAADTIADVFTFVIAGDSIALQNTDPDGNFMGVFWDDDNTSTGYGDYNTVLREFTFEPKSRELVELPEGVTAEPWIITTSTYDDNDQEIISSVKGSVAIDFLDVYVQGLFPSYPNAWIKGTLLGEEVIFDEYQYLGQNSSGKDAWAVGLDVVDGNVITTDIVMAYDEENSALSVANPFSANASETGFSWVDLFYSAKLVKFVPNEYTAPFVDSLNSAISLLSYTTIDANGDGKTWAFDTLPYITYNTKLAADDWFITPAIQFEADKLYAFQIEARALSTSYPEKFEVKLGNAPTVEALTTTLLDTVTVSSKAFEAYYSEDFTVAEAGKYYIGIHGVSDPDQYKLVIRNLSVQYGIEGVRPDSVTKASFVADAQGGLNAVLSFTAPALDSKKNALEGDVSVILALNDKAIDTIATTAGAEVVYPISVEEDGAYSVTLTPYVIETKLGAKTTVSTWIGLDAPAPVDTLIIANTGETLELTWPAVGNVGAHKGLVRPEEVTYNVYTVEIVEFFGMQMPMLGEILNEEPITGTSFSIPNDFENQDIVYYAVTAENDVDESEEVYASVLAGLPYELPLEESFDNGKMSYYWDIYYDDDSDWNGEAEGNGSFRLFFTGDNGGLTYFASGMVNVKDADNPIVSVETKSFHGTPLSIFVRTASGAFNKYTTLETTAEFATQTVSLKDFTAENWIQVYFVAQFPVQDTVYLDKIALVDQLTYNLALSLDAPATVKAGGKADLVINVKNLGQKDVADYVIKVYADDQLIDEYTKEVTDVLAFLQKAEFVSKFEPSIFSNAGDVTLRAEVVFAADENTADNADEVEITVKASEETPVQTVAANATDNGISVNWTIAEASVETIVEDFESYDQQIITDGESVNGWLGYDLDKKGTYGWQASSGADWPYSGEAFAFAVWTPESVFGQARPTLANGANSVIFISSPDGQNDDWLVSPELTGEAQTISFKVSELTSQYGAEEYEVYYSTTDRNVESFTKVYEGAVPAADFSDVQVELPAGAKYFAIRYVSNDIFGFIVDDITYESVSVATPTGFNIYVNETLVATVGADATSYDYATTLNDGATYKVSVTAIYGEAESEPVNANVGVNAIEEIGADVKASDIYNMTGIRVRADKQLKSGVYVIDGQKTSVK